MSHEFYLPSYMTGDCCSCYPECMHRPPIVRFEVTIWPYVTELTDSSWPYTNNKPLVCESTSMYNIMEGGVLKYVNPNNEVILTNMPFILRELKDKT